MNDLISIFAERSVQCTELVAVVHSISLFASIYVLWSYFWTHDIMDLQLPHCCIYEISNLLIHESNWYTQFQAAYSRFYSKAKIIYICRMRLSNNNHIHWVIRKKSELQQMRCMFSIWSTAHNWNWIFQRNKIRIKSLRH